MKTPNIILLSAILATVLTSCSGKLGSLSSDYFKVNPNPLEAEAGHVEATINGLFPEKYMQKKAVVTVTPELRFEKDGAVQTVKGQPATFQGEKVLGNDQIVNYRMGGQYTMRTRFAYEPAMQKSDLWLTFDARLGNKAVEVPAVKVAEGVVATSELYHQTLLTAQPSMATDAFQRVVAQKQEANIKFLIQQAELRKGELKNNSVQEFVSLLQRISADRDRLNLRSVEVSAYASPDGGFELNERLANKRQENTEQYVKDQLRKADLSSDVETSYTAQDWEGFQQLVQASSIQDKDVILRVLSMYKDPQEREQQIKNMSYGFRELADGILPELRRARLTINYETVGRSDEEIMAQLRNDASKLSVEELLYAAAKSQDAADKQQIYQTTTRLYPADVRAYNNLAAMAYAGGRYDEARQLLEKARGVSGGSAEVSSNLGLMALLQGDTQGAEALMAKGVQATNSAEALGNLHLAQGNYARAEQDFGDICSNSAALAQIQNKNYAKAARTLRGISRPDGMTDYLQAVLNARQGNREAAAAFLQAALQKDASLRPYAERDKEMDAIR
ncbi:MAG: tetratricopeptide repeat protein [Prevotella sp.]|nr:tetratricopeptide repeat protein [Prevotella sp.]